VLLKLLSVIGGAATIPLEPLERLAELATDVRRPGPVDDRVLDASAELTHRYAAQFEVLAPQPLLELVTAHLNQVGARLDLPAAPSLRARLGTIASETAALAGWLAVLSGRRGEAHSYFAFARDAARDADDPELHALALGSLASLYSALSTGAARGSMVAVRLLQQSLALIPCNAKATARAWLAGRLAGEQALLGDAAGFARNLERSGAALAEAGADGDRPGVFTGGALLSFWGKGGIGWDHMSAFGAAVLGDRRAIDRLAGLLPAVQGGVGRSNVLVDLATVHLQHGEVDAAAALAVRTVALSAAGGWNARLQRVAALRERMPLDVRAVGDLDEHLAAVS
jgi:hypothetical protein